ncbi:hypothetical protein DCAR_0935634 [Daucus carota subsp. sativus]|uniref:TIR domain-containing protein n=1 Tax=Daucus carota subsp. sativus TaxID=79200 RepID=A0AAF1BE55_DAUCS|nr:hypothetical protein DCAR_0935634 [Daucus carota subsp. sativus]
MAASTSTNQHGFCSESSNRHWNVFLSFRGEDTRKTFTAHLYTALKQAGVKTFMDDYGLPRGEEISKQLLKAIQGAEISLIIFSANYASSPWCLNELVEILECKQRRGQLVYPVFYNVSPAVVRHRTGSFSDAFESHEERYGSDIEKVDKWKAALTEAAGLSGYDLQSDADGYEARFIQIIVNKVLLEVNLVGLNVAKEPVGIESRVEELTRLLSNDNNDIRKIGIYGMGGIGKTTIAKALYNKNFHQFEGSCFLANVREASEGHDGIPHLQEQLLSEILVVDKIRVENEDRGINLLMERLSSKKVLIVLDDLNNRRQFDYLAGQWNQFALGSRIIVTTRDAGLLEQIEVDSRYSVEELDRDESLELFSRHAFRKPVPSDDYMELSEGIIYQAGGLPLALEVLGSYLFKRSMTEWRSSLHKLQQIPRNEIQKKLLISYHALGDGNLQDVFLDIACYFIGNDKDMTISILNSCGFDSENGIIILIERCLLSINEKNEIRMHDLLQEMGRDITRNNCPNEPWKHSRLWSYEDICNALNKKKGKKCIECIIPYGGLPMHASFETSAFRKMHKLRLLSINKMLLSGSFEDIFEELRWLSWQGCSLESLPINFQPTNLVFLDLRRSNFKTLWNGPKCLQQLKILNISGCTFLKKTPDFSRTPCIEDLNLSGCTDMDEVDPSIGHLLRLVNLNLTGCIKLKCLPSSVCNLTALEQLDLEGCSILEGLPQRLGNMQSLSILRAGCTAITTVPGSIECLSKLVILKLNRCKNLRYLPSSICKLRLLEDLILCGYSNLEQLPDDIGDMESLKMLSAEYTGITYLPESIGRLSKLKKLLLHSCNKLRHLPSSICHLKAVECLGLNYCSNLQELPEKIGNMESLKKLQAVGTDITTLPESTGRLSKLVKIELSSCKRLEYLPRSICNLRSLECLDLSGCSTLEGLPDNIGEIETLRELRACNTMFMEVPKSIGCLKNLEILALPFQAQGVDMNMCSISRNTGFIPASVWSLFALTNLNLSNCYLVDLPDSIGDLSSLQHLNLSGNRFNVLTSSLGQLSNLKSLSIIGCEFLWAILELPPNLSDLYASYCASIETLVVSKLSNLRCLYLSYCTNLVDIEGLNKLESIARIEMAGCENLLFTADETLFQVPMLLLSALLFPHICI